MESSILKKRKQPGVQEANQ
jgi:ribosome assembly protein RRB1